MMITDAIYSPAQGASNMATPAALSATPANPSDPDPAPANPAVARCIDAYNRAGRAARAKGEYDSQIGKIAARAYREAMPIPVERESIRDFIACVARGVALDAIDPKQSAQLLSAARTALSVLRREPKASNQAAA